MEARDMFSMVLARLEKASADARMSIDAERRLEIRLERTIEPRLKAAEAKIYEWAEYAGQLRAAIDAIDPTAVKRKKIVLPDMPRPLETEIPF